MTTTRMRRGSTSVARPIAIAQEREGSTPQAIVALRNRQSDLLLFIVIAAGLLLLTAVPYLFGYLTAPPGKQFMGIVLNVPDTAQYLSWARESGRGLLIENKLTPEPDSPAYFNLFWLAVGRAAAGSGMGLAEMTQVARLFAGAAYLAAIYWFVSLFSSDRGLRWVAFLVIALGSGLGWIWVVGKQLTGALAFPLDVQVMETNTLLTILAFPHQAMAAALLVLILGLAALALERSSLRLALTAGFLGLLLGLQHGYDLLLVYAVVGAGAMLVAWRERRWLPTIGLYAAICLPSLPAALYLLLLTRASPVWRGVLAQYGNAGVYTPSPPHLLVLLGIPLLLVVVGLPWMLWRAWRHLGGCLQRRRAREILLGSWLVLGLLLPYIPTDFQIKLLVGLQLPVGLIATRALFNVLLPRLRALLRLNNAWLPVVAAATLVLAVLPTSIYLLSWRLIDLGRHDYPYYLDQDNMTALHWLEANSSTADVVLSSLTIGQFVPALSGNKAFLAHWAQTLDFYAKERLVRRFFDSGTTEDERQDILAAYGVRYVFWSAAERSIGTYDPASSRFLRPVFAASGTVVFQADVPGNRAGRAQ